MRLHGSPSCFRRPARSIYCFAFMKGTEPDARLEVRPLEPAHWPFKSRPTFTWVVRSSSILAPCRRGCMDANSALNPTVTSEEEIDTTLLDGVALCLSGGGYRAMLFHAGTLWRLNELGWLKRLNRVSCVSGGSITAGVLGLAWSNLDFGPDGIARK